MNTFFKVFMNSGHSFFTIGHATREIEEFGGILKGLNVALLADVRSVPRSRTNPEYNEDALPEALKSYGIEYIRIPELGGFRPKSKTVPPESNGFWTHNSFHSYADYATGEGFRKGLDILLKSGKNKSVAVMCAEMLWWRCHRRIIADYLIANGQKVFHIINENSIKPAELTSAARVTEEGIIFYPSKNQSIF